MHNAVTVQRQRRSICWTKLLFVATCPHRQHVFVSIVIIGLLLDTGGRSRNRQQHNAWSTDAWQCLAGSRGHRDGPPQRGRIAGRSPAARSPEEPQRRRWLFAMVKLLGQLLAQLGNPACRQISSPPVAGDTRSAQVGPHLGQMRMRGSRVVVVGGLAAAGAEAGKLEPAHSFFVGDLLGDLRPASRPSTGVEQRRFRRPPHGLCADHLEPRLATHGHQIVQ